jgi:glucose/arabinose dehydrogenase
MRLHRALAPLTLTVATTACGTEARSTTEAAARPPEPAPKATTAAAGIGLASIGRFAAPVYLTSPPGDRRRLFVVEQAGRIRVVRGGKTLAQPFLDIRSLVTSGGEQGLLSVAFPPDHARTGLFYVYYTDKEQNQRVIEYRRANADRADPGSARLVLRMEDHEANHNGGLLKFGPDGLLYVGTGDGGGGNDQHGPRGNAQNLGSLLGKLLRIDPRRGAGEAPYGIPRSNPFVGRAGVRGEIYSFGLRNPWRFSFDRSTGDLSIADVGQDKVEEVDFTRRGGGKGANWGWRPLEGTRSNFAGEPNPAARRPVIEHTHAAGFCSITGGYVVRDRRVPALVGRYVYGDFCEGRIRAARLRVGHRTAGRPLALPRVDALSSFGEDAAGRVYALSLSGPVYRFVAR